MLVPAESADELVQVALPGGATQVTPVGRQPHDAAAAGPVVVVGNELGGSISFIRHGSVVKTLADVKQPGGVVGDGTTAAVVDVGAFTLSTYDLRTLVRTAVVPAGAGPTHAVLARSRRILVVDTRGNALLVFSVDPLKPVGRLALPGAPYGMAIDPATDTAWITLTGLNQLVGVDLSGPEPRAHRPLSDGAPTELGGRGTRLARPLGDRHLLRRHRADHPMSPAWAADPETGNHASMRILVTGGAGFIGRAVVARLMAGGADVVVLDSLRSDVHVGGLAPALPPEVRLDVGDVRDRAQVARALKGVDAVVHLAAKVGLGVDLGDLDDYVSTNDLGTAVLVQEMARAAVGRLVVASSMVVYGEGAYHCVEHGSVQPAARRVVDLAEGRFEPGCPVCAQPLAPELVVEEAALDPRNGYAATKLHQEHLAAVWARETGGQAAAMRFHNVYGPGLPKDTPYAGVASLFASALRRGEAPRVFEDGGQRRDFVHVDDVAAAVQATVRSESIGPAAGLRSFNVGSGVVHTIGELARRWQPVGAVRRRWSPESSDWATSVM